MLNSLSFTTSQGLRRLSLDTSPRVRAGALQAPGHAQRSPESQPHADSWIGNGRRGHGHGCGRGFGNRWQRGRNRGRGRGRGVILLRLGERPYGPLPRRRRGPPGLDLGHRALHGLALEGTGMRRGGGSGSEADIKKTTVQLSRARAFSLCFSLHRALFSVHTLSRFSPSPLPSLGSAGRAAAAVRGFGALDPLRRLRLGRPRRPLRLRGPPRRRACSAPIPPLPRGRTFTPCPSILVGYYVARGKKGIQPSFRCELYRSIRA